MNKENISSQSNKESEKNNSENKTDTENTKGKDYEFLLTLPKFEKNYENQDLNLFKDDILNYLNERDKSIFNLIRTYKEKIEKTVVKAYMGLTGLHKTSSRSMPKGEFFFVGPTGVGKTELSKALAKFLFGDEQACIRFDMSEYAQENSDQKLIGAAPGYVGYEEGGQLTNAI